MLRCVGHASVDLRVLVFSHFSSKTRKRLKQGTPNYRTSFEGHRYLWQVQASLSVWGRGARSLRVPRPQRLLKSYFQSSAGNGSSDMNLRMTFSVILETLFSQLFSSREPHQAMELEENMPPPSLVVK